MRSNSNTAELRQLGADAVIETDRQDMLSEVARITGGRGARHALDCVGGEVASQVVRCLGLGGHLVLYGTLANTPMCVPVRDLMMPVARIEGFLLPNWLARQSPLKLLGVLSAVKKLTLAGVFHTEVTQRYSLDQVATAVQAAVMPGRTGKVMLQISA